MPIRAFRMADQTIARARVLALRADDPKMSIKDLCERCGSSPATVKLWLMQGSEEGVLKRLSANKSNEVIGQLFANGDS